MGQVCQPCCKNVNTFYGPSELHEYIQQPLIETLTIDPSFFEGYEIHHEPTVNQNVLKVLASKISYSQSPKQKGQEGIKHIQVHQAYIDQFMEDELYTEDSSKNNSFFKQQNGNKIQTLPIYFRFKKTGVTYNGQWKTIKGVRVPHGQGRCFYPNASYYEGLLKEGMPHYYGLYVTPTGDQYEGEIKYGRADGSGCYTSDQGIGNKLQYRGQFKNNQRHGIGTQKSQNFHFHGKFQYDSKLSGLLKFNGITYEGGFQNDKYHGKGKLTLPGQGGCYQGDFLDGTQNGYGEYSWPDGSLYRGGFKDGKRQGFGEYYNAINQSTAKGIWKDGILNGHGQYINRDGQKIKCIWENNKISGLIN